MGKITRTQFGCTQTKTYTQAQFFALQSADAVFVPAVPGKSLWPVFGLFRFDWTADVVSDAASILNVAADGAAGVLKPLVTWGMDAGVLASGNSVAFAASEDTGGIVWSGGLVDLTTIAGLPLLIRIDNNAVPFSGGDPANLFTVEIHYLVI